MQKLKWMAALQNKQAQKQLEESIKSLLTGYFSTKSEYASEKFVKSFSEKVLYLENSMLLRAKLHPSQIKDHLLDIQSNMERTNKKLEQIEMSLLTEIKREQRHYSIIFSEFA